MIHHRIIRSLQRQDWTMVSIEFVLVVLGVLLGFQINGWGTEREQARARTEATARLLEEAEEDVSYLQEAVDQQKQRSTSLNFVLERIAAGQLAKSEEERFAMGLYGLEGLPPLAPPSSVYDDIVSSGTLSGIGDAELRRQIAAYRASLAFEDRMQRQAQESVTSSIHFPAITVEYEPSTSGNQTRLGFDFKGILADPALRKELVRTGQIQRFQVYHRQNVLNDAVKMCDALGRAVGQPCRPAGSRRPS
jgi:hypothetical protein